MGRIDDTVFVEGGATASAVIRQLGWSSLTVQAELAPGVVVLQPTGFPGMCLITKPGSYSWPDEVIRNYP